MTKIHHIVIDERGLNHIKAGGECYYTLFQEDVQIRIRSWESFRDNEARADYIKTGKYMYYRESETPATLMERILQKYK